VNQAIQFPLAELHTQCEMVRALLYKTADLMDKRGASSQAEQIAMLNLWANRLCCDALDRAIQVHGGMGYSREYPFEHLYRHHRRYRITEAPKRSRRGASPASCFGTMGAAREGTHERTARRVKIIEIVGLGPVPFGSMLLADMGAT